MAACQVIYFTVKFTNYFELQKGTKITEDDINTVFELYDKVSFSFYRFFPEHFVVGSD